MRLSGTRTRSDRSRRLASLLLTLLLLMVGAPQDGYGLHRCPHHDATGAPAGQGGHAAHAAHAAHGGHASDTDSPAGTACTCVGVCHTSADLPRAPLPHVSMLPLAEWVPERGGWVEIEHLPAPLPFSLPYPTAPPLG